MKNMNLLGPAIDSAPFAEMVRVFVTLNIRFLWALEWRHHALGMLQAELTDTLRVHVWHPRLVRFDSEARTIHDHRFDLVSHVFAGVVTDHHYYVHIGEEAPRRPGWENDDVTWKEAKAWQIRHAKVQQHDMSDFSPLGTCFYRPGSVRSFGAGETYKIARRSFHTSRIHKPAVTFVHRSNFDAEPARVLGNLESAKDGHEVITGIIRSTSEHVIRDILYEAEDLCAETIRLRGATRRTVG